MRRLAAAGCTAPAKSSKAGQSVPKACPPREASKGQQSNRQTGRPEAPALVESEAPALVKSEAPALVKSEAPAYVKSEAPAFVKSEAPAYVKSEAPAFVKSEAPALIKSKETGLGAPLLLAALQSEGEGRRGLQLG